MSRRKLLLKLLAGNLQNVRFSDFQAILEAFGFELVRVSGSHHIYAHQEIRVMVNIQNIKGQAKPYQIRQALKIVELHNLHFEE